jgi:hypothetical protein
MNEQTFTPGPTPNTLRAADGNVLTVPEGWALLLPGDAALTRRVKEAGDHWVVQEKKAGRPSHEGFGHWRPSQKNYAAHIGVTRVFGKLLALGEAEEDRLEPVVVEQGAAQDALGRRWTSFARSRKWV